jgi:hypothetical protein
MSAIEQTSIQSLVHPNGIIKRAIIGKGMTERTIIQDPQPVKALAIIEMRMIKQTIIRNTHPDNAPSIIWKKKGRSKDHPKLPEG